MVLTDLPSCKTIEALTGLCKINPHHPPLEIDLENVRQNLLKLNNYTRLTLKRADYPVIIDYLGNTDWRALFQGVTDPNIMLNIFYSILSELIEQYVSSIPIKNNSGAFLVKSQDTKVTTGKR